MATVLEELLIQIGVDVDERSLEKFNQVSERAVSVLNKVAIAGSIAATAIAGYTLKMAGASDESIKFARMTGIAFDSIQELEFAAQKEGAAIGELTSNLGGLNDALGQLAIGRGPQEAVRRLGGLDLSFADLQKGLITGEDLLLRVGEAIQGLSPQRQAELTGQMGITKGTLKLLQQGRASIEALRIEARKYGVENIETAKKAEELKDTLLRQKAALNKALIPLRMAVMELANNLLPKITEWIKNNQKLISQLPRLITIIGALFVTTKIIKWGGAIASVTKLVWGLVAAKTALSAVGGGVGGAVAGGGARMAGSALLGGGASVGGAGLTAALLPIITAVTAVAGAAFLAHGIYKGVKNPAIPAYDVARQKREASQDNSTQTFNIYDATDARAVAREVRRELKTTAQNGNKDFAIDLI